MGTRDRKYPEAEYQKIDGGPLEPARLAQIWATLPEGERLPFLHSLDETIADNVLAATMKYAPRSQETAQ